MSSNVEKEPSPQPNSPAGEPEKRKRECGEFGHDEEKHDTHAAVDMSKIILEAEDLYNVAEAQHRLQIFGPNKLEGKEENAILQFLSFMWNPLSWVMEAAALVAIVLPDGPPDWEISVGIVCLLFVNSAIGFYEERNAGNALKALMDSLAPKAKVKRDGSWSEIESADLVPGDMIAFKTGNIVPADCRLTEAVNVSIDQAALTGESLPQPKKVGDQCFSGSTCKQGEAEGVVISTAANTFFGRAASIVGRDDDTTGHLQKILAQIGTFCLASIGIFIIAEIFCLYAGFRYKYRRGLNDILVLLIGGVPIAMPTVLSVTLAVGAQQLAKHKAIITRITAIEELAGVTILCSDKTGTLTMNRLTIDRSILRTYGPFSAEDVILLSSYASRTEDQDAMDAAVTTALGDLPRAHAGIKVLDFKPFNCIDRRTEATYREEATGKLKRVTKGMVGIIIQLCTRNRTDEIDDRLEIDVNEFSSRGFRTVAVAYEELEGDDPEAEGNGFELIGMLPFLDPPRDDTKKTIDNALALGVKVKIVTGDQLSIAKETGRRIGVGDHMYATRVLRDGPAPGCRFNTLDDLILDAEGFAGVFPEHKCEILKRLQGLGHLCAMTGDSANDAPALSCANVGIAVEGASDTARGAADIALTEPGLSAIVHAIRESRIIFQRMRNYSIYACAVTIRVVVCFSVLAFAFNFDFPPFMVLIIALLNEGTIMTLPVDRVLPSNTPESWDPMEIFAYAIAYGLYLAASTIALVAIILKTHFFQDKFGVTLESDPPKANNSQLHMIVYLQVTIISQALIFVTRSHGFFFMERPSYALLGAFGFSQLISSIIAAYGNWGFTDVAAISGGWIVIVWVWNIAWLVPLDWIKFGMKFTIIKCLRRRHEEARILALQKAATRTERLGVQQTAVWAASRAIHESLYSNRVSFIRRAARKVGLGGKVSVKPEELRKFSSIQAQRTGATLARRPHREKGKCDLMPI